MHDSASAPFLNAAESTWSGQEPMQQLPQLGNRRAVVTVDLTAIARNVSFLKARTNAALMAVVKADGYGHGAVEAARAALAGGADWLGVALPSEAVALRDAGIAAPILAWLWPPTEDIGAALAADVTLVVSTLAQLERVLSCLPGTRPDIHLKLDTGLGRGGASQNEWVGLCRAAAEAERQGRITVSGLMSHLASAEVADDPSVAEQTAVFTSGIDAARKSGLTPTLMHLANSAATLLHPNTHFDLVRCGIAIYGLDPTESYAEPRISLAAAQDLRPAMTLRAQVVLTKRVPAGHGVSYGLTFRTSRETTLALVPLGYADGVPRAASGSAWVGIGGVRYPVVGRIAMDQLVVDVGDAGVAAGDEVTIFGVCVGRLGKVRRLENAGGVENLGGLESAVGEASAVGVASAHQVAPTAKDWAVAADTIDYEIVTRIGSRVPREYLTGNLT